MQYFFEQCDFVNTMVSKLISKEVIHVYGTATGAA
jgi:hypothetical protein